LADVDCFWSATYQAPGAAERLAAAVARYRLIGFTHYVRADDDGGWYLSDEGLAFWEMAVRLRQIASLAVPARLQPVVRQVAARFPQLTLLCHHMAGVRLDAAGQASGLAEVLASAALPNIHIKLSGYHYVNPVAWDYPYPACRPIVAALYEAYGAERLHWGSDYPVVRPAMSYQQALEAVGSQADFIATAERQRILGDSLAALLVRR
jgi:predicted TIM-barrel fold metal-dependent hydrolase